MTKHLYQKFTILFFVIFLWQAFIYAQLPNQNLTERWLKNDSSRTGNLYFQGFSQGYFRNNEYFSPVTLGETFMGYWFTPSFKYYADKHFSIEVGANIHKEFGTKDFTQVSPRFRLQYQKDSLEIIFGNLHSNFAHRLIEPLFAFEQTYRNPFENGLQIRYQRKKWQAETWVDWQQLLNKKTNQKEIFWAGLTAEYFLIQKKNIDFSILTQNSFFHRGGQDLLDSIPAITESNLSIGLKTKIYQNWIAEIYFLSSDKELSTDTTSLRLEEASGKGWYANLTYKSKMGDFLVSYFQGNNFRPTQMGGAVYSSISNTQVFKERFFRERELIFLRYCRNIEVNPFFNLSFRAETYYDLKLKLFEYNYGLYLHFQPQFLVRKNLKIY